MIKYILPDLAVTFAEIPDEICLCFNLSLCPHRCPGCHSSYLQTDVGEILTKEILKELIITHNGATCVLFMGGDNDKSTLQELANAVKEINPSLKTAWYCGEVSLDINKYSYDYIKVGNYVEALGGLNSRTTNQRMYKRDISSNSYTDITYRFWR